jgi:hypothetical protein
MLGETSWLVLPLCGGAWLPVIRRLLLGLDLREFEFAELREIRIGLDRVGRYWSPAKEPDENKVVQN